jgi:cobalt-zinc-cadmium efflux system protein
MMHVHAHDDHHTRRVRRDVGRRRLVWVLVLTASFMFVELVGGWLANSLALMADAGHMLSDVAAHAISLFALTIARRPATPDKTYGYMRIEILAALVNGAALCVIALAIFWQAWQRLARPEPVEGGLMLVVAAGGLAVNVIAAFVLHRSAAHSLNVRGAYLHVLGDLLGSVGAIAAALIILGTGWLPADPLISCAVAGLILIASWRLVRESVDVLLEAVPRGVDLAAVRAAIVAIPGVEGVHDLHVWTLTSGFLAMSGHARVSDLGRQREILDQIHQRMHAFHIDHVTVQIDPVAIVRIREREGGEAGEVPEKRH